MTWRKVVLTGFGGPERLEVITENAPPQPEACEVRVRIRVTSAAFTDVMIRKGMYPDVKGEAALDPWMRSGGGVGRGRRCRREAGSQGDGAMRNLLSGVIALAFCLVATGEALAQSTALTDVTLVDVETATLTPGQSLLIRDGLIAGVGPEIEVGDAAVFDARGGFLIPGLWDSHVHIFSSADEPDTALPLYLTNGVTGIRDMGALWPLDAQKALQARIESGDVQGPRLVLAGAWIDATPGSWPGMFLADTPPAAKAVVAQIASEGWAAVKSYSMLDEATYLAIAEAAQAHGLPLVGHVPERIVLSTAVEAKHAGMEHFGRVTMACSTTEAQMIDDLRTAMAAGADRTRIFKIMAARNRIILETWDERLCETVLARLAAKRMHVSPTLVVADFYVGARPASDTPRMRMLPAEVREAWGRPDFRLEAMTDEVRTLAQDSIALDRRTFLMAHAAGVPILASSDASFANPYLFHGASLLDELDLYVAIGLTPREALYTATVAPPRFFGLADQDGVIAPGRRADLVLLKENPLDDLATLRRPQAVITAGRVLDRQALDDLERLLLQRGERAASPTATK